MALEVVGCAGFTHRPIHNAQLYVVANGSLGEVGEQAQLVEGVGFGVHVVQQKKLTYSNTKTVYMTVVIKMGACSTATSPSDMTVRRPIKTSHGTGLGHLATGSNVKIPKCT